MASKSASTFVAKSIAKLYLDVDFADVHFTFETDDNETAKVPAHKSILAIRNPVFRAMFFGPMKTNDVVEIVDASASAFKEFLQFFYLADVTLTMENIEEVLRLADKYDMPESFSVCATFLKDRLTADNLIWGYQLAITLNYQSLMEFCDERIKIFTKQTLKSNAFLNCDKAVVEHILKSDSLNCRELDLFIGCIEWVKSLCRVNGLDENDPLNLRSQLGDCFHLIRFETMTLGEIGRILANDLYRHLFSKDELADLICLQTDTNFNSKAFEHTKRNKRSQWNSKAVLSFTSTTAGQCYTQCQESTWFSVNVPLLMGEIVCRGIFGLRTSYIHSTMYIREYNELTFSATDVSAMLYKETVYLKRGEVKLIQLPHSIEIQPKKVYEVCFDIPIDRAGKEYYHYSNTQIEYKLNEEITIKFNRNPNKSQGGLVASLNFNPFDC